MGNEWKESRFRKQKRLRVLSKPPLPLLSWHLVLILSCLIDALWKSSSPPPACLGSIRSPSSIGEAGLLRWVPLPETPKEERGGGSSILNPRSDASPSSACSAGEKEPKKGWFRQRRKPREPLPNKNVSNQVYFAPPWMF